MPWIDNGFYELGSEITIGTIWMGSRWSRALFPHGLFCKPVSRVLFLLSIFTLIYWRCHRSTALESWKRVASWGRVAFIYFLIYLSFISRHPSLQWNVLLCDPIVLWERVVLWGRVALWGRVVWGRVSSWGHEILLQEGGGDLFRME